VPTEEERAAATEQGFNGDLNLAVLPRKIMLDMAPRFPVKRIQAFIKEDAQQDQQDENYETEL
jgi:hypothetical protein